MTYVTSYKKGVCMIPIRYRLFKSILMVCILQFMIGCGNSVDDLTEAAGTGNVEKVKQILTDNPDLINQRDSKNETALYWAINSGNIEVIEVLLARDNIDIAIPSSDGEIPLIRTIIMNNPNIDQVLVDGTTQRLKMIEMLLEADAKLDLEQRTIQVKDKQHGLTPLICAIAVKCMDIDRTLGDGSTARLKMIEMLLEADAKLDQEQRTIQVKQDGLTPLIHAIGTPNDLEQDLGDGKTHRLQIVKMLLKADKTLPEDQRTINVPDPDGDTPLDCAINLEYDFGFNRIIEVLKDKGAKTSAELKENR